jgi:DNA-binding HxlR family transcriptional regulator
LAKDILYSLIGGRRRFTELRPLLRGKSDNNLADALRLLMDEHAVDQFIDPRARPAIKLYELSPLGLLVVDWMRRYEVLDEIAQAREDLNPQPSHA